MAAPLNPFEISLIKKMLRTDWKNAAIQFYFNTPERQVNNGRISEIKSGYRGKDVPAASQYELDEFLDHHPLTLARLGTDEPETPQQLAAATQFIVNENEQLEVRTEPLSEEISGDPNLEEIYLELRGTAHEFFGMGHNTLGDITPKVEAFSEALPVDSSDTTINRIWMRGNKLRMVLGAHDQVANNSDMHPAKLDVACAEALRSVVQAFNVFTASSPKATELDQASLGPDERRDVSETFPDMETVIRDADKISTPDTQEVLLNELEAAQTSDQSAHGDRQVAFTGKSISNFLGTAIVRAYRLVRFGIKSGVAAVWTKLKEKTTEVVTAAAVGIATPHATALIEFLKTNYTVVADFLAKSQANPAIQQFLEFVVRVLGIG